MMQLPVYQPSQEEINDPVLYAKNVRRYMVWPRLTSCTYLRLLHVLQRRLSHLIRCS